MRNIVAIIGFSALGAALVAAGPAAAQNDASQAANDGTEVVCRRNDAPTGTRLGRRNVCKTQAEWDAIQSANREAVERQQDASHWSAGE
ncbi:MAG: hypothetical protein H7X93_13310 [Sphingomonadaceae bacterium]|nr:hypothetical protein [Sphingomonadaceae bacterium]